MKSNLKQNGTAIVVALFVTALVATAAIIMMEYLQIDTRRTQLIIHNLEATQLAQGSIDWAIEQLIANVKQKQNGRLVDQLPLRSPIKQMNNMKIYSTIYDAQSRLNLNNLSSKPVQEMFMRLVQIVSPKTKTLARESLTRAILDWITPGIVNSNYDIYYKKLNPPYRSAHRLMASVSELRLIQGMNAELYKALAPVVTALPEQTNININTASIPVIMSLSPNISMQTAKTIREIVHSNSAASPEQLAKIDVVKKNAIQQNTITTMSSFFLVITHVVTNDQDVQINTLLKRMIKDSEPTVIIIWQSKGTV